MAPRSAKMSTAGKTKSANNNNKKSSEGVQKQTKKKVSKTKQNVNEKNEVPEDQSKRKLRRRSTPEVTESKSEIKLPLTCTKFELRIVIRFLCASGMAPIEIERMLNNVYGDATSRSAVFRWCRKFRGGRSTVEDEKRSGRPHKGNLPEKSAEVLDYIKTHRHARHREIGYHMNLSWATTYKFIKDNLKYNMFVGCWVPIQLSQENKEERLNFSTVNLARCKSESLTTFINRIVVADQTWVYFHTTPLNKRPPPLKNENGEIIKRKKKELRLKWSLETGPSPGFSLLMTVFWDCAGVVAIDFKEPQELPQDRVRDKSSLEMLHGQVCAKRPGLLLTGLKLLMNENLWGEEMKVVDEAGETITSRLTSFGWQGLFNPANSPDLSPSDYHLFQPLKKHVCGKRFVDADAGKRCVVEWLWAQDPDFFATGVQELVTRWERCIKVKGDYLDN